MILSSFVQDFKDWILQNISDDNFSEQRIINELEWASNYMFRYLNVKNVFWYAAVIETLTVDPLDTRRFPTTYRVSGIIEDVDDTNYGEWRQTKNTGVLSWSTQLKAKNLVIKNDEWDFYKLEQKVAGCEAILTTKEYSTLEVRYKRLNRKYSVDDLRDPTAEVDMPEDLLWVLQNLMFWRCFPKNFLENWRDIANAYYNQAKEELENYAKDMAASNQRFTA